MNEPRTCGGCTACCFTPGIVEIGKPRDTLCGFARPGQGCACYAVRPAVCKGFKCMWLLEGSDAPAGWKKMLREEDRPDKSGVYFTPNGPINVEGRRLAWLAAYEAQPGTGSLWNARKLLQRISKKTLVLVVWRAEFIGPRDLVEVASRNCSTELYVERRKRGLA